MPLVVMSQSTANSIIFSTNGIFKMKKLIVLIWLKRHMNMHFISAISAEYERVCS